MRLENKTAVVYGASGAIGQAVAHAFANEGAKVFVTGRNREAVEAVAKDIVAKGGIASAGVVDALDEKAVDEHLNGVINREGRLDISFASDNASAITGTAINVNCGSVVD